MNQKKISKRIYRVIVTVVILCAVLQGTSIQVNATSKPKKQKEFLIDLKNGIQKSQKLNSIKYSVKLVNDKFVEKVGVKCNTVSEAIKYLEKNEKEIYVKKDFVINLDNLVKGNLSSKSKKLTSKTETKSYSRGWGIPTYKLQADFTYNTKTKKITSVKNRKFTMSGITAVVGAANKSYSTNYTSTRKKQR